MGCGGTKYANAKKIDPLNEEPTQAPLRIPNNDQNPDVGFVIHEKGSTQIKPLEITAETLQKYLDLEKEIQLFERKHVLDSYQVKVEQLEQLEQKLKELETAKDEQEQTANRLQSAINRKGRRQSVKEFLMSKNQDGDLINPEEEEYVDILNRLEVLTREIESTESQRDHQKKEVEALAADGEELQKLYGRRDDLLDNIFGGAYGSSLENRLEKELELLQERKKHVDQAHFKWKQAQMMVKQGCHQLGLAVQKWKELLDVSESDIEQRYICAAETRNNLVAATQNLEGAHRFLPNISFPYCTEEEIDTLNKAITFIFTDMQTPERHEHALECYRTTYKRCGALKQWFDQVLNTTISKDLTELTEETKVKAQELKQERIRLIRSRVKDITGKDVDFDEGALEMDAEDLAADEQVAQLFEAERVEGKYGNLLSPDSAAHAAPTPVPVSDLAPMPSNEEIFGKIDELRKKHAAEMAEFEKAQTMNKARTKQGLQEKLQARRNRRSRIQAHERELESIQST